MSTLKIGDCVIINPTVRSTYDLITAHGLEYNTLYVLQTFISAPGGFFDFSIENGVAIFANEVIKVTPVIIELLND